MNAGDEHTHNVSLYLDNELRDRELEDFRAHLGDCADCKSHLEEEQALADLLRRSRPLYRASEELRARVIATQQISVSGHTPDRLHGRVLRLLKHFMGASEFTVFPWRAVATIAFVFVLGMAFVPTIARHARAVSYVDSALTTHRNYLDGRLPLEIKSESPEEVTAWFAGKVPFDFRLPTSQLLPNDQPAYRQVGARRVNYGSSYAALVTFAMKNDKISLLIAPSKSAEAYGGEEIISRGLTFHYHTKAGFNVITWTAHGLTYALVSSLHTSASRSCLVCHQNMADKGEFGEQ
jgi:anti-sigma factor RsiW